MADYSCNICNYNQILPDKPEFSCTEYSYHHVQNNGATAKNRIGQDSPIKL